MAADPDPVQVLDTDGRVRDGARVPDLADDRLVELYADMVFARRLDEKLISLQRQGRMGTYPSIQGHEAAQVASTYAIRDDDWIVPYTRDLAQAWIHGKEQALSILFRSGNPAGGKNANPEEHVYAMTTPIATHIPHAVGMAWAADYRGEDTVFMCYFGDGATSEGDFHEGLNFAGVFDLPAVFFCNNNQWAISVPRSRQTASDTIAQKADAYGIDGVQVDGMDPLAVYQVTEAAVEKARDPAGGDPRPTLIEALQYRFQAHTTSDDPSVYRDEAELEEWKERDPIPRFERFLRDRGLLDDGRVDDIEADAVDRVDAAVDEAAGVDRPAPDEIFAHVFEDLTPALREQREWLLDYVDRHPDEFPADYPRP